MVLVVAICAVAAAVAAAVAVAVAAVEMMTQEVVNGRMFLPSWDGTLRPFLQTSLQRCRSEIRFSNISAHATDSKI